MKEIKIVIVEDNPTDIELLLRELKKSGLHYHSMFADTAENFESTICEFEPDLILCDYSLPKFDVHTALKLRQKYSPYTPFIIVSGTIGEENAVDLVKSGVTDYVLKNKLYSLPGKIDRALGEASEKKEKALAEQRLEENRKKLKEAQLVAKMGNWEMNLLDGSVYWCDQIYRILGFQPGEIKPSTDFFFSLIPETERAAVEEKFDYSLQSRTPLNYKSHINRKDGSTGYIYASAEIILDYNDKPLRVSGMMQDITETKKMEDDLRIMNKELETFIYRASHDLRGPLSSIIGLTNISKKEVTDKSAKIYLEMIEASAMKLDATLIALVQSMTMRDMQVDFHEVDLDAIIQDVLSQLKFHEGFDNLTITVDNALHSKIISNKLILTSIFQNLIQNAIKYQNYRAERSTLKISISEKKNGTEIVFEDNGIGIDDENQSKIFDMYFRGTAAVAGSGLGLYIVKIGVEKLKGNISFRSKIDKGTAFTLFLPVVK